MILQTIFRILMPTALIMAAYTTATSMLQTQGDISINWNSQGWLWVSFYTLIATYSILDFLIYIYLSKSKPKEKS